MMYHFESLCSKRDMFRHVSDLVWKAIIHTSIEHVAAELGVDERSIRRWRDGQVLPSLQSYFALCRLVESEGGDDSPFDLFFKVILCAKYLIFF